jgi:hypothetical protein
LQTILKEKKIIISEDPKNFENIALDNDEKRVFLGNIYLDYFSGDTLVIKVSGKAPILIEGMSKIKGEKIKITNLSFKNYVPIDTFKMSKIIPSNNDTADLIVKRKVSYPDNSFKSLDTTIMIRINDISYTLSLITEKPLATITWACTPGKIAYHIYSEGVKKYYVLKL